ncbi:MAG TPA: hypothetical protein ENG36_00980 [Lentisphaerae bacterium]|nr:hypothetical protein [Lentisphaerota bacterium]
MNTADDNTNLVIELYCPTTATNIPRAQIMNSVVRSLYSGTGQVFTIGTTLFDATGLVSMVNCSLSHILAPNTFIVPATNIANDCWIMPAF